MYKIHLIVIVAAVWSVNGDTTVGDIIIKPRDNSWKCDRIICPANTHRCMVRKQESRDNAMILERTNICYDKRNKIITRYIMYEPLIPNTEVNIVVNGYRHGSLLQSIYDGHEANADQFTKSDDPINNIKKAISDIAKEALDLPSLILPKISIPKLSFPTLDLPTLDEDDDAF